MHRKLGRNTVVLLGVGHTNAHVLRMWKMQPIANAQLICVSDAPIATYSGMLPGVLAGQYETHDMEIDLVRLCAAADARLVVGKVTGLCPENRRLDFANRPSMHYEILSVGVGSRPKLRGIEVAEDAGILPIKPMQSFLPRLKAALAQVQALDRPVEIAIVGGGIGSIEISFCLDRRLGLKGKETRFADLGNGYRVSLYTAANQIGPELLPSTRTKVTRAMENRGIDFHVDAKVKGIRRGEIAFEDGSTHAADIVIWAIGAEAQPLLDLMALPKDDRGFLLTKPTLQTIAEERIFAVGDSGTIQSRETPKAGVYAVRQGPILWDNINRLLWSRPLREYRPQRKFLKLINTADDHSIAEYRGLSFQGGWCWKLKDRIDTRFMAKYQDYSPMEMAVPDDESEVEMRCHGCGGKIGSELLSQVLHDLQPRTNSDVLIGLDGPDDAAIIKTYGDQVTVTTDFFASPLDDPYLVGRIALLNSASDCFVMGAQPTAALAMVQLPVSHPRNQLRLIRDLTAGSLEELERMNAALVGGHSIEGPRLTIGYTVLGKQLSDPKTKGQLKVGDCLILTKPLGVGVLLAALMQCRLPARSYQPMIESMLGSNMIALRLIQEFGISAITDVTGFGFAGHLAEMLQASHVSAEINIDSIPVLPGTQALIDAGIESTLAPDNRLVSQKTHLEIDDLEGKQNAKLFDPQTCGGILLGVSQDRLNPVLDFLQSEGFEAACTVGEVVGSSGDHPTLVVK